MKNYIQKYICKSVTLFVGTSLMLTGCSESFLDPDPQTMFEPETVFSTENGIKSVLAICDRQLKRNYVSEDAREMIALPTEYTFSDLMVPSATDKSGLLDNVDNMLRPNSDQSDEKNLGRTNSIYFFWRQNFEGVRNANTILSFIDDVPMDETLKNEYIGRAYFHRAYRYYSLVFQFGHVPLLTKLPEVPKQNYRSTHRDAILKKMVEARLSNSILQLKIHIYLTLIGSDFNRRRYDIPKNLLQIPGSRKQGLIGNPNLHSIF